ncbi:hypothetical protein P8891_08270 [Bacillus atrophaeus]|uniref:hypothetical protein n=1 Tax=Bacillus atrophaeus TaxID=1452 RepID=UPI002281C7EE|nr:hypothetical protein [Bacillus atrophaeus]MCY7944848.1 hypothetical protein [Bacillus atrophaeus]MCY8095448.1 hypothetical protein [Bacillus atrophaeus]MCY9167129.1 hypothetical protein [Bacillus atrophaeus]MEC0741062.1 hypothetical protein [Bacillus atrophaeus]MEC0745623.1 hypothetical protein [Bacillus atrophaeus]
MDDIRKGKPIKRTRRHRLRVPGDLDGLFQTFITIKTAEGKAKGTLQQYHDNYKSFEEKKRGLSDSTINTRLKTLRVMYNTLESEGLIDNNLMQMVC